jgi:hypothetical protein
MSRGQRGRIGCLRRLGAVVRRYTEQVFQGLPNQVGYMALAGIGLDLEKFI